MLFIIFLVLLATVAVVYTEDDPILRILVNYPLKFFLSVATCMLFGLFFWLFAWAPFMWFIRGVDNTWYSLQYWVFFLFLGVYTGSKWVIISVKEKNK